ncbi:MAG: pseudouridine synthase [Albidovulum sp.]|nr:pseudouridine synthase [Albidovulum sp.]
MIIQGRVAVNGTKINAPNLNVSPADKITVDGTSLPNRDETRLWKFYKPIGSVVTSSDEKGRTTIFEFLPKDLPRVMPVGRLDLNSEGLLLLTNNGELKRVLELPSTGWTRKYRVRAKGVANDKSLNSLRNGLELDGERFRPIDISLDRQVGMNAWYTVGIREGRNREIRRAMKSIGLLVNRLIRISFGPFSLSNMQAGEISEIRRKIVRDQLGGHFDKDEWNAIPKNSGPRRNTPSIRRNAPKEKIRGHRR